MALLETLQNFADGFVHFGIIVLMVCAGIGLFEQMIEDIKK